MSEPTPEPGAGSAEQQSSGSVDQPTSGSASPAGGGRRRAAVERTGRRRPDAVVLAAVVLPLVAVVAGLAVRVGAPPERPTAPEVEARVEATVLCPSAGVPAGSTPEGSDVDDVVPTAGTLRAATAPDVAADLTALVGADGAEETLAVADGSTADLATGDHVALRATGDAAGGLLAARFDGAGGAGTTCAPATTGTWFVGLGAGAERSSVVELTNPDSGTAVATLTLHDEDGVVDAESIRSVVLEAGTTRRLDLGELVPTRGELALQVDVGRGRLGVAALQTTQPLDGGTGASYWAAPVEAPARETTLVGLPGGAGTARSLLVANPGEETARVQVEVLGADGAFAPTGLDEAVVPPGTVTALDLTGVLDAALADGGQGAFGVRVVASTPVVASLRSGAGAAETTSVVATGAPADTGSGDLGALLPPGASAAGVVLTNVGDGAEAPEVVVRDAEGAEVAREEVALAAGASVQVGVPAGAARVEVLGAGSEVRGGLVAVAGRASVLALAPVVPSELVPTVRRAWP